MLQARVRKKSLWPQTWFTHTLALSLRLTSEFKPAEHPAHEVFPEKAGNETWNPEAPNSIIKESIHKKIGGPNRSPSRLFENKNSTQLSAQTRIFNRKFLHKLILDIPSPETMLQTKISTRKFVPSNCQASVGSSSLYIYGVPPFFKRTYAWCDGNKKQKI